MCGWRYIDRALSGITPKVRPKQVFKLRVPAFAKVIPQTILGLHEIVPVNPAVQFVAKLVQDFGGRLTDL